MRIQEGALVYNCIVAAWKYCNYDTYLFRSKPSCLVASRFQFSITHGACKESHSSMVKRLLSQAAGLDLWLDDENHWLHAEWKGQHNNASVQDGTNSLIELVTAHQFAKVINDTTNMSGVWVSTAGWLVQDALPRLRHAGMHSFAHVFGKSYVTRVSAEAALFLLGTDDSDIKTFREIESAMDWLRDR